MRKGLLVTEQALYRKLLEDRTLSKVAKRTGLSQPTLNNFFHGKTEGNDRTLDALRNYFTEEYNLWEIYRTLTRNLNC